jgi:hypothetical protein
MRRVGIVATSVTLVLAGCAGRPTGTDGDLANRWPAMPAAQIVVPVAGSCWATGSSVRAALLPWFTAGVPCASPHDLESAYVGQFTGNEAAAPTPPEEDSAPERIAYSICRDRTNDYLGGDWHDAMLMLTLVIPPFTQWKVGARWYRCDLMHLTSPVSSDPLIQTGRVVDGLRGSRPLALTCMATREDPQRAILAANLVDCAQPHAAEYAGTFTAPDLPWPAKDGGDSVADAGCHEVVTRYLGLGRAADWTDQSLGYWYDGFDNDRWLLGDRTTRCYAYAYTRTGKMVGSVRGTRNTPPRSG